MKMALQYTILYLILSSVAYNAIGFADIKIPLKTDVDGKNVTDIPEASTVPLEPPVTPNSTTTSTTVNPKTTTVTTTTPNSNTTTTVTTTSTTTPNPNTTTSPTTTTTPPTTTTTATTTFHPNTTTTTSTTTIAPNVTTSHTTAAPTTTEAPPHNRRFDGPSFIGGIVLTCGLIAIGFVAWKFYKARTERNYHTL